MDEYANLPGPFALLGAILRAWEDTQTQLVEENIHLSKEDKKDFLSQAARLEDSETVLMLGYVARAEEKTGRNSIMQATIVDTLAPPASDDASDAEREDVGRERQRVRQSIARRGGALKFFSLINREELTKTAVEFSLTTEGQRAVEIFEEYFFEELAKLKGGPTCLAAE